MSIENYRGLSNAAWTFTPGVSLLVGPNGSGKTTLLDVFSLLRDSVERGMQVAIDEHGGAGLLVNIHAPGAEFAQIVVTGGDLRWLIQLRPRGVLDHSQKVFINDAQYVTAPLAAAPTKDSGVLSITGTSVNPIVNLTTQMLRPPERPFVPDIQLIAGAPDQASPQMREVLQSRAVLTPDVSSLLERILGYRLHGGYHVRSVRVNGSQTSSDLQLNRDGTNVFSVLRNWRDARATHAKWQFVIDALKAAFPDLFEELEFQSAGQTLAASVYRPGARESIGTYCAPDGLLVALLHLTAIASAPSGGAVAIDEFENALHPFAIRALLDHIRDWSDKHAIATILATHSPVLINEFKQEPSRLMVMDPTAPRTPVPLDQLRNPEWLAHFSLGDLYANGDFGSQAGG